MNPQNPWLNISWNNTIADCDKDYLVQVGKKKFKFGSKDYIDKINEKDSKKQKKIGLDFKCLPEPFSGDVNSSVYCLNMNPGEPDPDFCGDKNFELETISNLSHCLKGTFWTDSLKNNNGKIHGGTKWLRSKTAGLRIDLSLGNQIPNLFFIDFFPYHLSHGFKFPEDLPSNIYRDFLVLKAMQEKKFIIIMRQKRCWFKAIPSLEKYSKLITLKCPAGGWLSKGNMTFTGRYGYDDLLASL